MTSIKEATVITDSKATSTEPQQLATVRYARSTKTSCLAILQVCRQTNPKSIISSTSKNSFEFTNVPDLLAFLRGIGHVRQAELMSSHIDGLLVDQAINKAVLHHCCLSFNNDPAEEERSAAVRRPALHPHIPIPNYKRTGGVRKALQAGSRITAKEWIHLLSVSEISILVQEDW